MSQQWLQGVTFFVCEQICHRESRNFKCLVGEISNFFSQSPGNQGIFSVADYKRHVTSRPPVNLQHFVFFCIAVNFVNTISVKETSEAL